MQKPRNPGRDAGLAFLKRVRRVRGESSRRRVSVILAKGLDDPVIGPIRLATDDFLACRESWGEMMIKIGDRRKLLPPEEFAVYRTWAKMLLNSIY